MVGCTSPSFLGRSALMLDRFILLCSIIFLPVQGQAQQWYRAEMVRVRGYNNDCDWGWVLGNEEGEFEVRASDNLGYTSWSYSGCMECDGNMNNATGVTCSVGNLIREQSNTSASSIRFENRAQEDDGVSNCDWPNDCHYGWGDQVTYSFSSYSSNAWQQFTRNRGGIWELTYRFKWTYVVPSSGSRAIAASSGVVTDHNGPDASYGDSYDGNLTIQPSDPCDKVRLDFTAFDLESGYDKLYVYNGNSVAAPLLAVLTGNTLPSAITSTASDGSLTLRFMSDGSATRPGFKASISNVDQSVVGGNLANPVVIGSLGCGSSYTDTRNNSPSNCYGNDQTAQSSDDIWYRFTLAQDANIRLGTCSSALGDTYLTLHNAGGTVLFSNDDDGPECAGLRASLNATLSAGTYYAVVQGYAATTGDITLNIDIDEPVGHALVDPLLVGSLGCGSGYSHTANNDPVNCFGNDGGGQLDRRYLVPVYAVQ